MRLSSEHPEFDELVERWRAHLERFDAPDSARMVVLFWPGDDPERFELCSNMEGDDVLLALLNATRMVAVRGTET